MRWLDQQLPAWRLRRAVTNGHYRLRAAAKRAAADLDALIGRDAVARQLADRLIALLDAVVRTSSASETINSILKPMLWPHRHFVNRQSAQHWRLNGSTCSFCGTTCVGSSGASGPAEARSSWRG